MMIIFNEVCFEKKLTPNYRKYSKVNIIYRSNFMVTTIIYSSNFRVTNTIIIYIKRYKKTLREKYIVLKKTI